MTGACLTVSQVRSIPWAAAPSSVALLRVTSAFVTPIVTRGVAATPRTAWAAARVGAPVSFREKETGAGWRKHNGQWDRWLQNSCAGRCCRNGHGVKWAFITRASDRASFRTLIALGQNHRGSGVALKVLATWVCCQRQRFAASFYRSRMTGSTALRAVACASQWVLEALGHEWCQRDELPSVVFLM